MAEAAGLKPGRALDLIVNQGNGQPWDLWVPKDQVAAFKKQEEEAPHFLIALCAAFSSLQHLNYRNMTPKELQENLRAAVDHLDFPMKMCEIQAKSGRLFAFEHPVQAGPWSLSLVKRLLEYKDVTAVDFDSADRACTWKVTQLRR